MMKRTRYAGWLAFVVCLLGCGLLSACSQPEPIDWAQELAHERAAGRMAGRLAAQWATGDGPIVLLHTGQHAGDLAQVHAQRMIGLLAGLGAQASRLLEVHVEETQELHASIKYHHLPADVLAKHALREGQPAIVVSFIGSPFIDAETGLDEERAAIPLIALGPEGRPLGKAMVQNGSAKAVVYYRDVDDTSATGDAAFDSRFGLITEADMPPETDEEQEVEK